SACSGSKTIELGRCTRLAEPAPSPSLVHDPPASVVAYRPTFATPAMTRSLHGCAATSVRFPHSEAMPASEPVAFTHVAGGASATGSLQCVAIGPVVVPASVSPGLPASASLPDVAPPLPRAPPEPACAVESARPPEPACVAPPPACAPPPPLGDAAPPV